MPRKWIYFFCFRDSAPTRKLSDVAEVGQVGNIFLYFMPFFTAVCCMDAMEILS
jgi:hypothetical protein